MSGRDKGPRDSDRRRDDDGPGEADRRDEDRPREADDRRNRPPTDPVFDNAPGGYGTPHDPDSPLTADEEKRLRGFRAQLEAQRERMLARPRVEQFLPYLLIRSHLGDDGTRPMPPGRVFWDSPDVWLWGSEPEFAPNLPPSPGGVAVAGQPTTLYALVWNLGRAPLLGAVVEFYWFDPTLSFDSAHAHLIGTATVDLPSAMSQVSRRLVKCPLPWIPVLVNNGHECLVSRVSGVGDAIGPNEWEPYLNRHVGQRNVCVLAGTSTTDPLLKSLDRNRNRDLEIRVVAVNDGAFAVETVAPELRLARGGDIVLGGVTAEGQSLIRDRVDWPAGRPTKRPRRPPEIDPRRLQQQAGELRPSSGEGLGDPAFLEALAAAGEVEPGRARVVRVVAYDDQRLTGGYTMVLTASPERGFGR
jgi:hypothetical protein